MYLIFDIGGTQMRVAKSEDLKTFSEPIFAETPEDGEVGSALLKSLLKQVAQGKEVKAIAGGIPGVLDKERGATLRSPNLRNWENLLIKADLEKEFDCAVFLENDANLVGLGEAAFGAGRGARIMVYITVSTGVGGTRIVEERVDEAVLGFEPGQQIIDPVNKATLEQLVSGRAVTERFGDHPRNISDPQVWEELAYLLAVGISNTIAHWSPEVVVLGGPMITGKVGIKIERVEKHCRDLLPIFPELPLFKIAELKDVGGLYGAMKYLDSVLNISDVN